jgi:hypothetical protein
MDSNVRNCVSQIYGIGEIEDAVELKDRIGEGRRLELPYSFGSTLSLDLGN